VAGYRKSKVIQLLSCPNELTPVGLAVDADRYPFEKEDA